MVDRILSQLRTPEYPDALTVIATLGDASRKYKEALNEFVVLDKLRITLNDHVSEDQFANLIKDGKLVLDISEVTAPEVRTMLVAPSDYLLNGTVKIRKKANTTLSLVVDQTTYSRLNSIFERKITGVDFSEAGVTAVYTGQLYTVTKDMIRLKPAMIRVTDNQLALKIIQSVTNIVSLLPLAQ